MTAITREDVAPTIENEDVVLRTTAAGPMTAAFIRLREGTDLGPALAGLEGDMCPCPHWGYMISGRLKMRTPRGDEVYEAGQAFYWEPPHVPVALTDCEYVDFSPTEEFAAVVRHITEG